MDAKLADTGHVGIVCRPVTIAPRLASILQLVTVRDEPAARYARSRGSTGASGGEGHLVRGEKMRWGRPPAVPPRVAAVAPGSGSDGPRSTALSPKAVAQRGLATVLELDNRRDARSSRAPLSARAASTTTMRAGSSAVHLSASAQQTLSGDLRSCSSPGESIDGGYCELAHRGSYENLLWVSPSTLYRGCRGPGACSARLPPARSCDRRGPGRTGSNGNAT